MRALTKDEFEGALHFECQALNGTDDIHEFMGEAIERALDKGSINFSSISSIEIRLVCKFVGPFTTACKRIYKMQAPVHYRHAVSVRTDLCFRRRCCYS